MPGDVAAPRAPIALLTTYYRPVIGGVETAAEHLAYAESHRRGQWPTDLLLVRTASPVLLQAARVSRR